MKATEGTSCAAEEKAAVRDDRSAFSGADVRVEDKVDTSFALRSYLSRSIPATNAI